MISLTKFEQYVISENIEKIFNLDLNPELIDEINNERNVELYDIYTKIRRSLIQLNKNHFTNLCVKFYIFILNKKHHLVDKIPNVYYSYNYILEIIITSQSFSDMFDKEDIVKMFNLYFQSSKCYNSYNSYNNFKIYTYLCKEKIDIKLIDQRIFSETTLSGIIENKQMRDEFVKENRKLIIDYLNKNMRNKLFNKNSLETLEFMLNHCDATSETLDNNFNMNLLSYYSFYIPDIEIVKYLIEKGFNLNLTPINEEDFLCNRDETTSANPEILNILSEHCENFDDFVKINIQILRRIATNEGFNFLMNRI